MTYSFPFLFPWQRDVGRFISNPILYLAPLEASSFLQFIISFSAFEAFHNFKLFSTSMSLLAGIEHANERRIFECLVTWPRKPSKPVLSQYDLKITNEINTILIKQRHYVLEIFFHGNSLRIEAVIGCHWWIRTDLKAMIFELGNSDTVTMDILLFA